METMCTKQKHGDLRGSVMHRTLTQYHGDKEPGKDSGDTQEVEESRPSDQLNVKPLGEAIWMTSIFGV